MRLSSKYLDHDSSGVFSTMGNMKPVPVVTIYHRRQFKGPFRLAFGLGEMVGRRTYRNGRDLEEMSLGFFEGVYPILGFGSFFAGYLAGYFESSRADFENRSR